MCVCVLLLLVSYQVDIIQNTVDKGNNFIAIALKHGICQHFIESATISALLVVVVLDYAYVGIFGVSSIYL